MGFVKASLLFLFRRIFGISKRFKYAIYVVVVIVMLWFLLCVNLAILSTSKVGIITQLHSVIVSGVINLAIDLLVLLLPLRMIWCINVSAKTKIKLTLLFLLGLL